jgi:hypothetical protein
MATRNLTKKFLEIRSASKANKSLNIGGADNGDEVWSDSGLLNVRNPFRIAKINRNSKQFFSNKDLIRIGVC